MISIQKTKTINFKGFRGTDTRDAHTNQVGSSELLNFRIGADGSLIKREGSRLLAELPDSVRALWTGVLWGAFRIFALCGEFIYEVDPSSGEYYELIGAYSTDTPAEFFFYRGTLYLVDGTGIYVVAGEDIYNPYGYVPLIAKDWSDNSVGEIYEPRNLLNNHGRLTYVISEAASSILRLDDYIIAVDRLLINGERVSSDRYTVGTSSPYVNVSGLNAGDRVTLCVTYKTSSSALSSLFGCTRAVVFGGISSSRALLFGGSEKSKVFCSRFVSEESLAASRKLYYGSDAMYFPAESIFVVGDGSSAISAVSRHYDRLLIFTENGAWMADEDILSSESFPIMNINLAVGVCSSSGAALLGNSPCTVGPTGVFRWTSDTDKVNDCNAYCISDPISSLLSKSFLREACVFADRKNREFLIFSPTDSQRVWVYSDVTNTWTSFDGIQADLFFDTEDGIGFVSGDKLILLDEQQRANHDGTPIVATFKSNPVDMGTSAAKRMAEIAMRYDGGNIVCSLEYDGDEDSCSTLSFDGNLHSYKSRRVCSGRFCYMRVTVTAGGDERQTVHTLELSAH